MRVRESFKSLPQLQNAAMSFLTMNMRLIAAQEAGMFISVAKKIHIFTKKQSTIHLML
jgi:hypothetical protein